MAMKQRAHIGTTTAQETVTIEGGQIARFVDALGIEDPRCIEPAAAKAAGLSGLMLPLVAAGSLGNVQSVIDLLELRPKQVLHSKESVTVFEPLCQGDQLVVTTTLKDLYEQQVGGNPMGFVLIEIVGTIKRSVRFEAQRVLAIRGGFQRR